MTDQNIPDEMQEILEDFIHETKESLSDLDRVFVDLEKDPKNLELINGIFRTVHSLKGAADFLGFKRMVAVTHKSESLLNQLRKETMSLTPEIMDVIFEAVDITKVLLLEIEKGQDEGVDIDGITAKLKRVLDGGDLTSIKENTVPKEKGKKEKNKPKSKPVLKKEESVEPEITAKKASGNQKKPDDEIMGVKAEKPVAASSAAKGLPLQKESVASVVPGAENPVDLFDEAKEQTIRVDVERLDSVMNLVGELVLARNRMFQINQGLESQYGDDENVQALMDNTLHLSRLTTDLQLAVLKTRMQPMRKVLSKVPRMVRDLARKKKKEVDLQIVGEETEVDKSIIEEIGDPLVHLIRNSVDHGIEIPDFRGPLGKPEKGLIRVSAFHEGDHIVIEIEDDGKGIDPDILRNKAVEKGLLDPAEAERLSEKECRNLIFAPGFSTAEKVTSTSGRGVGMDVVKSNISKLNGTVSVDSTVGEGTCMRIRLPLTVAIIQALMVGVENEMFAIPLSSVIETLRVTQDDIQTIDEKEVISMRDEILPLIHLSQKLEIPLSHSEGPEKGYVVITGVAEKRVGIVVTKLFGQEEIVIKPLGHYLKGRQEFSGATLTGDGSVIMILDVNGLMDQHVMVSLDG